MKILRVSLGLLFLALAVPTAVSAGVELFGAAHGIFQEKGYSTLYRIDPATGVATEVGPIGCDGAGLPARRTPDGLRPGG